MVKLYNEGGIALAKIRIILATCIVLLTACSLDDNSSGKENNSAPVTGQENTPGDITESEPEVQEEQVVVNEEQLYLANGPGRERYEQGEKIEVGKSSKVTFDDGISGEVSIDKYEIFDDKGDSDRKGLAIYVTEKNTSNESLKVGELNSETINLSLIEVFYNDLKLGKHKVKDGNSEDYITNQYVEFDFEKEGVNSCTKQQELKAGESRQCVYVYSYAGTGEYFIALSTEVAEDKWANYLLNVVNAEERG